VQELRKQSRLRYSDVVQLAVVGDSPELTAVLAEHAGWLADQCRAVSVRRDSLEHPLGATTLELAGARVEVALARA